MDKRVIYQTEDKRFRILELPDYSAQMEDLKGDCFNYEVCGYTGTREELSAEEKAFEQMVEREGVYGYVLERWNPEPGKGYEHVDSCFGYIGQYSEADPQYNHEIIQELKDQIDVRLETENE